jgi:hypothetical protein
MKVKRSGGGDVTAEIIRKVNEWEKVFGRLAMPEYKKMSDSERRIYRAVQPPPVLHASAWIRE